MLKRLLAAQDIDAPLGDIVEEKARRSRLWYCWQLLAIFVVASSREVRSHPLIALRAIATGSVALTIYLGVLSLIGRGVVVLSNGGYYIGSHWLTLPHLAGRPPYDALTVMAINALGFAFSGWAIVRLHRAHGLAMAVPFLALMTLAALIPLAIVLMDSGPGMREMPLGQMIRTFGTLFLSIPGGVVLGGYAATRPVEGA